nr:MAG TPA_asm: SINGLE-STRANDED DNA BINDING PROTEIN-BINDING PROTEIN, SINGLE STRANDED DNA.9A [Caudoviricetes sp.]
MSPGYRDRNGNWVSQPEQYYSVWPAGYANLNPVFDQIAQLRQNQDQFVDVTIVGEISGLDAYTNKKGEPAASCNVNASAVAITNVRQKNGGQQGYGAQGGYTSQPPASDQWANGGSDPEF